MPANSIIFAVIIPLFTAIILFSLWTKPRAQRIILAIGNLTLLVYAFRLVMQVSGGEILVLQAGGWAAPYGISFVVDSLSALMILLTSIVCLAVGLYSSISIESRRISFGYYPLLSFLTMGLCGAFIAGDIFNLYVWFEVIIISSFALITLGGEKAQLAGAMKYVTLNLLASIIFLTGVAVLYGLLGTLNLADLAVKVQESEYTSLINTIAILFFVGFGIKSALFPLFFWLPDSYHTPPVAVSAIFGGLLTKVGVYALYRVFSLLFIGEPFISNLISVIAIITMVVGVLGALNANNMRVIFSYLIISHIGFAVGGLGMFGVVALTGGLMYMVHDIIAKTNLFLISGIIHNFKGTYDITKMGGIQNDYPTLSIIFAITFFSVIGVPPLSGFWPKILLIQSAYDIGNFWMIGAIVIASFLTLWAIVRVWVNVFWHKPRLEFYNKNRFETRNVKHRYIMLISVVSLTLVSLYIGFFSKSVVNYCTTIAEQLVNTQFYIDAVLNGQK